MCGKWKCTKQSVLWDGLCVRLVFEKRNLCCITQNANVFLQSPALGSFQHEHPDSLASAVHVAGKFNEHFLDEKQLTSCSDLFQEFLRCH